MRFRAARWQRYQGCPALYSKPERRGILPVTVRGSATEKQILHEKFGGISRAFSVGLLVLMNSYFGMKWVYCV